MKTTKVKLHPQFVMTKQEIADYNALPDNMPGTKLTRAQLELIDTLYYKYCTKIDNSDWSPAMVDIEMKEKWPSGPRMKRHEAKRIVLNNLVSEQDRNGMSIEKAMQHFYVAMTCRPAYIRLVSKIWDVKF